MAAYTVAATDIGKYELTTAASTEDTVTFNKPASSIEVTVLSGNAPVYFRFGATTAVAKADGTFAAYPGSTTRVERDTGQETTTVVRFIGDAAAVVSVARS